MGSLVARAEKFARIYGKVGQADENCVDEDALQTWFDGGADREQAANITAHFARMRALCRKCAHA